MLEPSLWCVERITDELPSPTAELKAHLQSPSTPTPIEPVVLNIDPYLLQPLSAAAQMICVAQHGNMGSVELPGLIIGESLSLGKKTAYHAAVREATGETVVVKIPRSAFPNAAIVASLRHEYDITHDLRIEGVLSALEFQRLKRTCVLIFPGRHCVSAAQRLEKGPLPIDEYLAYATSLADALVQLHSKGVLHRDLNPHAVLLDESARIALLTELGSAIRMDSPAARGSVTAPVGALAYMAPEATGRVNRPIDERTDIYSLGMVLFEMLTGRPPFVEESAVQLLHAQLARPVPSPQSVDPSLPDIVCRIIGKCVAKAPEERYQGAVGLKADLERCRQSFSEGHFDDFEIGTHDVSVRLDVGEELFGRESPWLKLQGALDSLVTGRAGAAWIFGTAGLGKTALSEKLQRHVAKSGAWVLTGKFDQMKRGVPLAAFGSALNGLARQILGGTPESVDRWRETILHTLGPNAQIAIEIAPKLADLLGEQRPVEVVGPADAVNRLHLSIQALFKLFALPDKPVCLFLDDLQWADEPSLQLLEHVVSEPTAQHLIVVGTYRDDEVLDGHPLEGLMSQLQREGVPITSIALTPLTRDDVVAWVAHVLELPDDEATELGAAVHQKSGGNPLFVGRLLQNFVRDRLITFDSTDSKWHVRIDEITRVPVADNVVDFFLQSIRNLPQALQTLLNRGAYIGNRFDADTLASVVEQPVSDVEDGLAVAVAEGLVERDDNQFRFVHDKIQQSALELTSEADRPRLSLCIGRLLRNRLIPDDSNELLFDVAGHFNRAHMLITDPAEIADLIEFNIAAGTAAHSSAAFVPAARYLRRALTLVQQSGCETLRAENRVEILAPLAECEYVSGNTEEADRIVEEGLAATTDGMQRARLLRARVSGYFQLGRYDDAIRAALLALSGLGLKIRFQPNVLDILTALVRTKLAIGRRRIMDLHDIDDATDPKVIIAQQLLEYVAPAAYNMGRQNLIAVVYFGAVHLCITRGFTSATMALFAGLAVGVANALGNRLGGYEMGQLAIRLADRYPSDYYRGSTHFIFGAFLKHWGEDARAAIEHFDKGLTASLASGNLGYAGYHATTRSMPMFYVGTPISEVLESVAEGEALTRAHNDRDRLYNAVVMRDMCRALLKPDLDPTFDEDFYGEHFRETGTATALARYYVAQQHLRFLRGEHADSLAMANAVDAHLDGIVLFVEEDTHCFLAGLSAAYLARHTKGMARVRLFGRARRNLRTMKKWARLCPINREQKALLLEAETHTVEHAPDKATRSYEMAVEKAMENGYVNDATVVCLCAARYFAEAGPARLAEVFYADAITYANRWGATGLAALIRGEASRQGLHLERKQSEATHAPLGPNASDASGALVSEGLDLKVLADALRQISGSVKLSQVLEHLTTSIVENAGAHRGILALADRVGISVEAIADGGSVTVLDNPVLATEMKEMPHAIVYYVWRTKETLVISNVHEHVEFASDPYVRASEAKSILCVPILVRGSILGVVCLENNLLASAFSSDRVQMVQMLAAQAAVSIENARLYRRLEARVEERTRALKAAQERVVRLEREATEVQMAGGFAHEMRNALASARNLMGKIRSVPDKNGHTHIERQYAAVARTLEETEHAVDAATLGRIAPHLRDLLGSAHELDELLGGIEASTSRAMDVTTQILDYSRLLHEAQCDEAVDLSALVDAHLQELEENLSAGHIELSANVEPACIVRGRAANLHSVVSNLVINAQDALLEQGSEKNRRLAIDVERQPSHIILRVTDNGPGMTNEVQERLFDPFFSTKGAKGTGLGMSVVRRLIVLYEGSIEVESAAGEGTAFTVRLPAMAADE